MKAMGGEGLRVAVPTTMELPQTLQPYLFVREGSAEIVADNVKELAEVISEKHRKCSKLSASISSTSLCCTTACLTSLRQQFAHWLGTTSSPRCKF